MNHGSLFSGIGGFDLAAEWMGWNNLFHCEWNPFGQKVLKHYWPEAESFHDITQTDFKPYANRIDILTGGFPCQPYSLAGKRKGKDDERHLWPEMLRAIREIQPRWVVGENVFGLINWSGGLVFHEVQSDLEAEGYEVFPYALPAAAVNAPHRRDRVWFVAHRNNTGNTALRSGTDGNGQAQGIQREQPQSEFSGSRNAGNASNTNNAGLQKTRTEQQTAGIEQHGKLDGLVTNTNGNGQQWGNSEHEVNTGEGRFNAQRDFKQGNVNGNASDSSGKLRKGQYEQQQKQRQPGRQNCGNEPDYWENFPTQSPICTGNDGFPTGLDGITFPKWRNESIKAAGNAIVPQVALQIFKAIEQYEQQAK